MVLQNSSLTHFTLPLSYSLQRSDVENSVFANEVRGYSVSEHLWCVLFHQRVWRRRDLKDETWSLRVRIHILPNYVPYGYANRSLLKSGLLQQSKGVWPPHWQLWILNGHFTEVLGMTAAKAVASNMSGAPVEHFCSVWAFGHDLNESQKVSSCKFTQISAFTQNILSQLHISTKKLPRQILQAVTTAWSKVISYQTGSHFLNSGD